MRPMTASDCIADAVAGSPATTAAEAMDVEAMPTMALAEAAGAITVSDTSAVSAGTPRAGSAADRLQKSIASNVTASSTCSSVAMV